jgi:hypothetical protein
MDRHGAAAYPVAVTGEFRAMAEGQFVADLLVTGGTVVNEARASPPMSR